MSRPLDYHNSGMGDLMESVTGDLGMYKGVPWASRVKKNGLIVMTDLDKTMTNGCNEPTGQELSDRRAVRDFIDTRGAVGAAVSARTVGLMLSSSALRSAQKNGYEEPEPHWGVDPVSGKRIFAKIEDDPFFYYCTDWDMAGSMGDDIVVRHSNRYAIDRVYSEQLTYGESYARRKRRERGILKLQKGTSSAEWYGKLLTLQEEVLPPWRSSTLAFLAGVMPDLKNYLNELEIKDNYDRGVTNSAPLKARIQLHFVGTKGYLRMHQLKLDIALAAAKGDLYAQRIKTQDESKLYSDNPEKNNYVLYLLPDVARKENIVRRMFHGAAAAGERPVESLRARSVYADDAFPGFKVGLWGPVKNFLLPHDSPLVPYILDRRESYGTASLKMLWKNGKRGEDPFRRVPGKKGVWQYYTPGMRREPNTIVIADERYPNTTPPGSLAECLEELAKANWALC